VLDPSLVAGLFLVDILDQRCYNTNTMKTMKLDRRYAARGRYGYEYAVNFRSMEWKRYFALKSVAVKFYGDSHDIKRTFIWREQKELLLTAPWAYHYDKSSKPTFVYFRTKEDMERALMLFALTG